VSLINMKRLYISYVAVYVLTALTLYPLYTAFELSFQLVPAIKAAITALGASFGFVYLVERYIWTWKLFRLLVGIKVPFVHGRWAGFMYSSVSQHKQKYKIILEFHQSLHQLVVWYYDKNAITQSRLAGFALNDQDGGPATIHCVYQNQPVNTSMRDVQAHSGTMELYLDQSGSKIKGIYYNNPHQRPTYGNMELSLLGRKLLGRFEGRGR